MLQLIKQLRLNPSKSWWAWTISLGLLALLTGDTTRRSAYMNFIYVESMWLAFNIWAIVLAILFLYGRKSKNSVARLWLIGGIFLYLMVSMAATLILTAKLVK